MQNQPLLGDRPVDMTLVPSDSDCLAVCMQVPVPGSMRAMLVVLGIADFAITFVWEHFLRWAFPAKKPPQKGYMAFVEGGSRSRSLVSSRQKTE